MSSIQDTNHVEGNGGDSSTSNTIFDRLNSKSGHSSNQPSKSKQNKNIGHLNAFKNKE